jgi:hypothetical protein
VHHFLGGKTFYEAPPEYIGRRVWVRWDGRVVRIAAQEQFASENGRAFPSLRAAALRLTQRTAKFLRWLRSSLLRDARWRDLIDILRHSYASI